MFRGFRESIARGNIVDLAVAFVIGAAFGALVNQPDELTEEAKLLMQIRDELAPGRR